MFSALIQTVLPAHELACAAEQHAFLAIYHLHSKIFSRSKGQSSIAAAAYRSSTKICDVQNDKTFDYSRKKGTVHSEIIAPEATPSWALDRESLWNTVEAHNRRKDTQLCREVEIALPRELSLQQNIALTKKFVTEQFLALGMIADFSIHHKVCSKPEESADGFEYHAHILLTLNTISSNGFGTKNRSWNNRERLVQWRAAWSEAANTALKEVGSDERIDERSLQAQKFDALTEGNFVKARELDRVPEPTIGMAAFHMKKRGLSPARFARWLSVKHLNLRRLWRRLSGSIKSRCSQTRPEAPSPVLDVKPAHRNIVSPEQ